MPQLKIVLFLFTDGPARMGVLASSLGVSLATATGIVDRLVERNIVVREIDPEDRRAIVCRLSDKGRERVAHLWELGQDRARSLLEGMTTSKLRLVAEAMDAILQAASALEPKTSSQQSIA